MNGSLSVIMLHGELGGRWDVHYVGGFRFSKLSDDDDDVNGSL